MILALENSIQTTCFITIQSPLEKLVKERQYYKKQIISELKKRSVRLAIFIEPNLSKILMPKVSLENICDFAGDQSLASLAIKHPRELLNSLENKRSTWIALQKVKHLIS